SAPAPCSPTRRSRACWTIWREGHPAGAARAGRRARRLLRERAVAGRGARAPGLSRPVHRLPQSRPDPARRGRPADQRLVTRAPRGEGAARDLSAGLHAEASDEGDGADPGGGAGDRVAGRIPALTRGARDVKGPAGFRRAFAFQRGADQPKMILSAIAKIAVSTKPAQNVPLSVASSFLPALALSGVAGPTTALPSTMARMTRNTMSIVIFAGRAVGVKNAQWLAAAMKNSIGIDSTVLGREATPPRAPRTAASGIAWPPSLTRAVEAITTCCAGQMMNQTLYHIRLPMMPPMKIAQPYDRLKND